MDSFIVYATYTFSLILVMIFSIKEFNAPEYGYDNNTTDNFDNLSAYAKLAKPTLPKYMADSSRYNAFMLVFAIFSAVVYFLFAKLLLMLPGVDELIGDTPQREALVAIISVLLLIGIVKSEDIQVEKIQFFIKWPKVVLFDLIKDWLHSFAYIPGLGCDVFNTLCYEELDSASTLVKNNISKLINKKYHADFTAAQYIEESDFQSGASLTNMNSRWARLSYFIFIIEKWSNDPRFKNQVRERSLKWFSLKEAYILAIDLMVKYRDKNQDMTQEEEKSLSKQIDELLANCYRLISCVVIMTAKPTKDPLSYIQESGLKVHPSGQIFARRGEIFRVFFAMVPTIAVIALIYTLFEPKGQTGQVIHHIIVYIESAIYMLILPILIVLGLKRQMVTQSWRVVTSDDPYQSFFDMPLCIYAIISMLAWGTSLGLMMLLVSKQGLSSDLMKWKSMAVYCFISAITAFIVCYRTDIPPKIYKSRAQFLAGISTLPIIHGALIALTVWSGLNLFPISRLPVSDYWQFPLLGFFVSLVIGYTLFWGKHSIERRTKSDRITCNEPATVIQNNHQLPAIMVNKSPSGVMLVLGQAKSLIQINHTIEVVFSDGLRKIGSIVKMELDRINVLYTTI